MATFCFRPITLWLIVNLIVLASLQTQIIAYTEYLSLAEFCTPEKVNESMNENQATSVYQKLINAFDDDDLRQLINESLILFKTQIEDAGRSSVKRKTVLVYHKKRICSMVNTLEHTLRQKGTYEDPKSSQQ